MLLSFPPDIQREISAHLPIQTYLNLRETCCSLSDLLPKVARLKLGAFMESAEGWGQFSRLHYKFPYKCPKHWIGEEGVDFNVMGRSLNFFNLGLTNNCKYACQKDAKDAKQRNQIFQENVKLYLMKFDRHHFEYFCNNGMLAQIADAIRYFSKHKIIFDPTINDNICIANPTDPDVLTILLQDPRVDPSINNNSAFKWACQNWIVAVVERLLQDPRVDPSVNDNWALKEACTTGDHHIVELLLQDSRVDPSANDNLAIQNACCLKEVHIAELLLQDPRVDPSANDNWAFTLAITNGHLEMVEILLRDPRVDPNWAFKEACKTGEHRIVERILQDPRIDPSANDNWTILLAAAYSQPYDRSANDNWVMHHMAAEFGHLHILERLLKDPRVDPSANDNFTIRKASINGHLPILERLLQDPRVDPSAADNLPLRGGCMRGHLHIVERLLQDSRVDPSANDNLAIHLASENGHLAVVERLLQDPRVDPSANNNMVICIALFLFILSRRDFLLPMRFKSLMLMKPFLYLSMLMQRTLITELFEDVACKLIDLWSKIAKFNLETIFVAKNLLGLFLIYLSMAISCIVEKDRGPNSTGRLRSDVAVLKWYPSGRNWL